MQVRYLGFDALLGLQDGRFINVQNGDIIDIPQHDAEMMIEAGTAAEIIVPKEMPVAEQPVKEETNENIKEDITNG